MADQKVVDKSAKKISNMYKKGLSDIINTVMKAKGSISNAQFAKDVSKLDMVSIVKEKFKEVNTEYIESHKKVLETINAFGKTKND